MPAYWRFAIHTIEAQHIIAHLAMLFLAIYFITNNYLAHIILGL